MVIQGQWWKALMRLHISEILSYNVFQLSRSIDQIIAFDSGCLSSTHLFFKISANIVIIIYFVK